MGTLFCQPLPPLHLADSLILFSSEKSPVHSNQDPFCFELKPVEPFWMNSVPSFHYYPGILGDLERFYDANEYWIKNVGTERLMAASRSFVAGAFKCLPAAVKGRPQKILECGFERAEKTFKSKPPPIRFDVVLYSNAFEDTDGAYMSLIADWE